MSRSRSVPRSASAHGGGSRSRSTTTRTIGHHSTGGSSLKIYGDIYSTYELPGTKIYRSNEVGIFESRFVCLLEEDAFFSDPPWFGPH